MRKPPPPTGPVRPPQRYHALDALRAGAMWLGIVLHASVAYMHRSVPGLTWPVHEPAADRFFDWLFWWIHGFRIPLFFVVAGFFSAMLINIRGPWRFLHHRTRRILKPYLLLGLAILVVTYYVWAWGWVLSDQATPREVQRWRFADAAIDDNFKGPAHLWFLQELYLFCIVAWLGAVLVWNWRGWDRIARPFAKLWHWHFAPLVFAIPTIALVIIKPALVYEFDNTFVPRPLHMLYGLWFYVTGLALYRAREDLTRLSRGGVPWLVVATALFILMMRWRGGEHGAVLPAIATGLFTWTSIFGWLGVFLRWLDGERPVVRYLSDASYWVYLVHLPLVGLGHIALYESTPGPGIRFLLVLAGATAVSLLTYALLVRYTFIGAMLNGPRRRRRDRPPAVPSVESEPATSTHSAS